MIFFHTINKFIGNLIRIIEGVFMKGISPSLIAFIISALMGAGTKTSGTFLYVQAVFLARAIHHKQNYLAQ